MFLCDLTKDLALDTQSHREAFRSSNMPSFVEQARKEVQKGARNRWIAPMVKKAEMGAYIHWWMSSYVDLKAFWIDAR